MKKFLKQIISISLIFTLLTVYTPITVKALGNTELGCGTQYELSVANADGTFTKKACYNDFYSARDAMTGENDVVRHSSSLSPMKIVAMKSGIGYTYPNRDTDSGSSLTIQFYQYIDSGKSTSSDRYREFIYYSTGEYNGNGHGTIYVNMNGFKGYTDMYKVDLIPQIFIENNVTVTLGGNDSGATDGSGSYEVTANRSYYSVEVKGNYTDLVFTYYSGRPASNTTSMYEYSYSISQAPDFMETGVKYYSDNGYDFYTDTGLTEKVGTYYPYYVYLPLRTETDLTWDVFDNYANEKLSTTYSVMKDIGDSFIQYQDQYGVNALMVFAMGWHESAWGTSSISVSKNNLFGWNAVDTSPGESATYYEDVTLCVRDHMAKNLRGYLCAFDWRYFGSHLGNKGSGFNVQYATDPYWSYKIAQYAYDIDKFSNNYDGNLTDYDKYDLYLAPVFGSKLYKSDSFETKLYSLDYGGIYQEANIQVVLDETTTSFKVQSTNIVDSSGNVVKHASGTTPLTDYDWSRSVGYMKLDELTKINNFEVVDTGDQPIGNFIFELDSFSLVDNHISLSGTGYQPGIWLDDVYSLQHYLIVTDNGGTEQMAVELLQTNSGIEHYEASDFIGLNIDISGLEADKTYELSVRTEGSKYTETSAITSVSEVSYVKNNIKYTIVSDETATHLILEDTTVDPTPSPTPTPTPTPDPGDVEVNYYTWLDSYNISDTGTLSLDGYAFVTGKDNGEGNISHRVEVVDLKDGSVTETINLNTTTGEQDITTWFNDGYDYSYAYYNGTADISGYTISEYKFNLITTVGGEDFEEDLHVRYSSPDTEVKFINDKYYQLSKEYYYSYRLELTVEKSDFDTDRTVLPTYMESSVYVSGIEYYEESGTLRIGGNAFVWKSDFSSSVNPNYVVYLINTVTGDVYYQESAGLNSLDGLYYEDMTVMINDVFDTALDYSNIWFDVSFDVNSMSEGTYIGVVKIATDEVTDYVDLKTRSSMNHLSYTSISLDVMSEKNSNNKNRIQIVIDKK